MSAYYFNVNVDGHSHRIPCEVKRIRHDGHPQEQYPTGLYLVDVMVTDSGFGYLVGDVHTYGGQNVFSLDKHRSVHDLVKRNELEVTDERRAFKSKTLLPGT